MIRDPLCMHCTAIMLQQMGKAASTAHSSLSTSKMLLMEAVSMMVPSGALHRLRQAQQQQLQAQAPPTAAAAGPRNAASRADLHAQMPT